MTRAGIGNKVYNFFDGQKLLENDEYYYNNIIKQGFYLIQNRNGELIPINKTEIKYELEDSQKRYQQNKEYYLKRNILENQSNNVVLYKDTLDGDIQSFYELKLEIEVKGICTEFGRSMAYEDKVYVRIPDKNEELRLKYHEVFGEPQPIPELAGEQYDCGKSYWRRYFIIDKKDIDKIIGIKRYLDISSFGEEEKKFTGEVEEIVLDMRNFDEKTYQFFKEHGMLEIEEIK
jgi:hypothetical protein